MRQGSELDGQQVVAGHDDKAHSHATRGRARGGQCGVGGVGERGEEVHEPGGQEPARWEYAYGAIEEDATADDYHVGGHGFRMDEFGSGQYVAGGKDDVEMDTVEAARGDAAG